MAVLRAVSLVIGLTVVYLLVHALYSQGLVDHGYGGVAMGFSHGLYSDNPSTPILRQLPLSVLLQEISNATAEPKVPL